MLTNATFDPATGTITLTLKCESASVKSKSGKTFTVCGTRGNQAVLLPNLGPVKVGVNVFSDWDVIAQSKNPVPAK